MGSKLFVGNLNYRTDDDGLRQAFEGFGVVKEAKVITDRDTGRSRGFGFVTFEGEGDAKAAISGMDGSSLDGRNISVREAEERGRGPGGAGGRPPRSEPQVERRGGWSGGDDGGGSRPPRRGSHQSGGRGRGWDDR